MNMITAPAGESTATGKDASEMVGAAANTLDLIDSLFSQRDTILDDAAEATTALDFYALAVEEVAAVAVDYDDRGLEAACRRMVRHLCDLRGQGGGLGHDELDVLEQWLGGLVAYLATPADVSSFGALVHYLQDPRWPGPLSASEAEAMLDLAQKPRGLSAATHPGIELGQGDDAGVFGTMAATAVAEELCGDATSAIGEQPDNRDAGMTAAAELVLEDMAALVDVADQTGLLGLQEICLRVQQGIDDWRERNGLDETVLDLLAGFSALAQDYLVSPQAPEAATALIEYLKGDAWPEPLAPDEAESLSFLLQDGYGDSAPAIAPGAPMHDVQENPLLQAGGLNEAYTAEPQTVSLELIALLNHELTAMQAELAQLLAEALVPGLSFVERQKALDNYADQIGRLGLAVETVGLSALKQFVTSLQGRVRRAAVDGLTGQQHEALVLLPGALLAYLSAPDDQSTCEGLIDLLRGDTWAPAPDVGYTNALSRGLSMVTLTQEAPDAESRQTQAHADDVMLTLPADLSQELLDGLLQEMPLHTSEFSAAIQHLVEGGGTHDDIDVAKRAAHTLKGAANTVGIKGIANLTHHIEDILVALSRHDALPNRALAETLSNAGDCLEAMGEAVMGTGPEPDYSLGVLQEVLDWANRIDREGVPESDVPAAAVKSVASNAGPQGDAQVPADAPAPPQSEAMVRVPASLIDELLRLMGETIISTGQVRERLRRLVQNNKLIQQQNSVFLQLATDLEELVDLRGAGRSAGPSRAEDEFDPLEFEHYSELHTVSRRLIEAATDAGELSRDAENEFGDLNELIEVQNRLHAQSQNTVLRTRMLPVATVVSRLQRSVRQAARLLDKRVVLNVIGADTMIDSNILNELVDPLMHMLRNAVDHGIEAPDQRAALGKPAEGRIELAFLREGNQVVVRCRDDGAGLNLAAIRHTAQEKQLLSAGQTLSDDELSRLILAPGFSTRTESTQVSGRGIGMDVVHSRVLQLKGGLNLHGTRGKGLEVEIRLPATLISTHALLVRAQKHVFAISSYGISDIHYVTPDQVQRAGTERFFRLGADLYPLAELSTLLHLPHNRRAGDRSTGFPVLLVRQDTGAVHAVQVQEIIDSSELVVKNLGRYVPKPQGVVGATILGDGSVAAVIDLPEVMRKPARLTGNLDPTHSQPLRNDPGAPSRSTALVVDDSLSARRATAQFMRDAGFEVRTAIDGLEAVSILDKWKPDILLVDMEMPRMNGLELTAHVRARSEMGHLPVIMITSRSTEKHRRQAEAAGVNVYLTKPFGDDQLLRHVMELTVA